MNQPVQVFNTELSVSAISSEESTNEAFCIHIIIPYTDDFKQVRGILKLLSETMRVFVSAEFCNFVVDNWFKFCVSQTFQVTQKRLYKDMKIQFKKDRMVISAFLPKGAVKLDSAVRALKHHLDVALAEMHITTQVLYPMNY